MVNDSNGDSDPDRWWHGGVFYQIYPRSYVDSNGDGVGDLPGSSRSSTTWPRSGVDGVWLSPVTCSPNRDWGYDVSDYRDIDPRSGRSTTSTPWCAEAAPRGIRILMDLVPNHTSDQHPWFVDALSGTGRPRTATTTCGPTPSPTGAPPTTGSASSAGRRGTSTGQRPVLTCTTSRRRSPTSTGGTRDPPRVRRHRPLLVGPRHGRLPGIDVCNMMIKDKELRDNPPATEDDPVDQQFMGVRSRLQHRPTRGARHPAPVAGHRRHLRARAAPHRRDQRGTS